MTKAAKVLAELGRIPDLVDQIRTVREELAKKSADIQAVDYWTDEYKQKNIADARTVAEFTTQGLVEQIEGIRAQAASQLPTLRAQLAPTGAEGMAARMEAADARSRVRSMVNNGQHIGEVLKLAIQRSDRLMIEAAKEEARWTTDGSLDGFDLTADRALVNLVDPETADVMRAENLLKRQEVTLPHEVKMAQAESTLESAIGLHYARENGNALALEPTAEDAA